MSKWSNVKVDTVAPIDHCPYCGSDEGYYTKDYLCGSTRYNHNYDGTEAENGDMYESVEVKAGKIAYCVNCDKRLFRTDELEEAHTNGD